MDININELDFKETFKIDYDVYVCKPKLGTKVHNILENTDYITDTKRSFVISGTVGETWVIDINKLIKTYCHIDNKIINQDEFDSDTLIDWLQFKTITEANKEIYFAAHLKPSIKEYPVQTSWGDILYANRTGISHGSGDFILCTSINGRPNFNDIWVVNGKVFPNTYDIREFKDIIKTQSNRTISKSYDTYPQKRRLQHKAYFILCLYVP